MTGNLDAYITNSDEYEITDRRTLGGIQRVKRLIMMKSVPRKKTAQLVTIRTTSFSFQDASIKHKNRVYTV